MLSSGAGSGTVPSLLTRPSSVEPPGLVRNIVRRAQARSRRRRIAFRSRNARPPAPLTVPGAGDCAERSAAGGELLAVEGAPEGALGGAGGIEVRRDAAAVTGEPG